MCISEYRQHVRCDNIVLHALAGLCRIRFEMLATAAQYVIKSVYYSTATVKNAVWSSFVNNVRFEIP